MTQITLNWIFLSLAIISEVIATSALKASNGFTVLSPSLIVVAGYISTYYFLSLSLRTIPIGIAYAIWSGVGLLFVSLIGLYLYDQVLDKITILGMAFIILGVVIVNLS